MICNDCFKKADYDPALPCPHVVQALKQACDAARKSQMDADIAYKNLCLKEEREHCALIIEDPIPDLQKKAHDVDHSGGDSGIYRHEIALLKNRADAIRKQPISWQFKKVVVPPEECSNCRSKKITRCVGHHATPPQNDMKFWRCTSCHHHWEA